MTSPLLHIVEPTDLVDAASQLVGGLTYPVSLAIYTRLHALGLATDDLREHIDPLIHWLGCGAHLDPLTLRPRWKA